MKKKKTSNSKGDGNKQMKAKSDEKKDERTKR